MILNGDYFSILFLIEKNEKKINFFFFRVFEYN
jgi:hypothetical protein